MYNLEMRPRNFNVIAYGRQLESLHPLKKAKPGVPAGGVTFAPANWGFPQFIEPPQLGDLPSLPGVVFPATKNDLESLTVAQIANLSFFYNDDFGIVAADYENIKRAKFKAFISGCLL